jgi:excinuclease ABC subunit A
MRAIRLRGARTHNLQNIDLDLEPGTLMVVTGPSGAGKSSLAFGTLYAEGQRRYVESFSAYARQFLERLARPDVDSLEPVPAAIAVDRRAPVKTSRSTVATLVELTDYAKQIWAQLAELSCTHCGAKARAHSPESTYASMLERLPDERVTRSGATAIAGCGTKVRFATWTNCAQVSCSANRSPRRQSPRAVANARLRRRSPSPRQRPRSCTWSRIARAPRPAIASA